MVFFDRSMAPVLPYVVIVFVALLVFAAGWRMCPPQNAIAGGIGALLFFLLHPAFLSGIQNSSTWDALFVMLVVTAWLWMDHWSLFMRSWVLAGIYAFGLWVGSSFVLWGLVAMVPWVIFSRRPLAAVGSLLTVFLGGIFLFSITWGAAWFLIPHLGRPLFTQWIRWGGINMPPSVSLPWCLLVAGVVIERFREMVRNRRADVTMFAAALLVITALFGSPTLGLALIAMSAPLVARALVKREFLFHRGVRWAAGVAFVVALVLAFLLRREAWMVTGVAMLFAGASARGFSGSSRLPWRLTGEAVCVGAFLAESLGTLLHLFPQ
jgi:hypothetical protein